MSGLRLASWPVLLVTSPGPLQPTGGELKMEAKEATGTQSRTERADFQETADPALMEAADRTADVKLLTYEQLYLLWERQQWQTQELDFTRDREDWHERISEEERFQRMYGLSSFFIGEQKVAEELGPIMRAVPTEDQKIFLCTQIADEARHVRFFERFYREVGVLPPPWAEGDGFGLFGYSLEETREFAGTCLMRRLKVIGLG